MYAQEVRTPLRFRHRHGKLKQSSRPVSHVLFQQCAGADRMTEEACEEQLQEAAGILSEHGYHEYLPRRWAKPGCEDLFWSSSAAGVPVLAFGLGAQTCIDGVRSTNTSDLDRYLDHSDDYSLITEKVENLEDSVRS